MSTGFLNLASDFGLPQAAGVAAAYALGCFNTAYYVVRWKTGQDIRQLGSGTAGSKNVGRVLGTWGFTASFAGDIAKGALAVWGVQLAGFTLPAQAFVMLAVTAGHVWPAQLGFRGGKGLATSYGALLFFDPLVAGVLLALCAGLLAVTRRFTVSGLGAYALAPLVALFRGGGWIEVATMLAFTALVLFAHRDNLRVERENAHAGPSA
jgi:glycerol-3-phosphate acyltransferase PlsY